MTTVAAIIPTVPPRASQLVRALTSVIHQSRSVDAISVAVDRLHEGPGITRTKALIATTTDFVACLDDDDEWAANHVELLWRAIEDEGADVTFSHPQVIAGADPFPAFLGRAWDPAEPRIFGCWFMARTELLKDIGGWRSAEEIGADWNPHWQADGSAGGEDWDITKRLVAAGARIVHVPHRTYLWHHDGEHYSGHRW